MSTKIPENFYAVEYLVGKFENKLPTSNSSETVPFWVCYETKDLTKALNYIEEQKVNNSIEGRALRVLKKCTTIEYEVV